MDCLRCQHSLHEKASFCHHCGQPVGQIPALGAGRLVLAVGVAILSLPALTFGGCFTLVGGVAFGVPLVLVGMGGLWLVWKLAR